MASKKGMPDKGGRPSPRRGRRFVLVSGAMKTTCGGALLWPEPISARGLGCSFAAASSSSSVGVAAANLFREVPAEMNERTFNGSVDAGCVHTCGVHMRASDRNRETKKSGSGAPYIYYSQRGDEKKKTAQGAVSFDEKMREILRGIRARNA